MSSIVVFGGTGGVGRSVLEVASADSRVSELRALQRRAVDPPLPRVREIRVENFSDLSAHTESFSNIDACIFALGASQNSVSESEYRKITVDFVLEAAKQVKVQSPKAAFVFVSGQGADPTGKSWMLFGRLKGEAENKLKEMSLGRLVVARPGGVVPTLPARRWAERVFNPLVLKVAPSMAIRSEDLARALLKASFDASITGVLENQALRELGASKG